jgi:hypothetical protein
MNLHTGVTEAKLIDEGDLIKKSTALSAVNNEETIEEPHQPEKPIKKIKIIHGSKTGREKPSLNKILETIDNMVHDNLEVSTHEVKYLFIYFIISTL